MENTRLKRDEVDAVIQEDHLESCVTTAIQGDDAAQRERITWELLLASRGRLSVGRGRDLPSASEKP